MTENEQTIRKQWLGYFLVHCCYNILLTQLGLWQSVLPIEAAPYRFYISFAIAPFQIAFGYWLYHCAYKKEGTKFLMFCIITTLLSLFTILYLYNLGQIHPPSIFPNSATYLISSQIMGLIWLVVCWRLRTLNLRLRTKPIENSL